MAATSVREFIAKKLSDTAAVTAYVDTRIFHGQIPDTISTYPVINFYLISAPNNFKAPNAQRDHFQINVRSQGNDQAETNLIIAEEIIKALYDYQGTTDSFDIQNVFCDTARQVPEQNNIYLTIIDVYISYLRS